MPDPQLLQRVIEEFWDTVPPVWGRVRSNVRANAVHDLNVTLVQFHILRHIRHGVHSTAELAERLQISRPAVSQAVDLLVQKGYLRRATDPSDRRYVRLDLTAEGAGLMDALYAKNRAWMAEKMRDLSTEELLQLSQALAILKKVFDPVE